MGKFDAYNAQRAAELGMARGARCLVQGAHGRADWAESAARNGTIKEVRAAALAAREACLRAASRYKDLIDACEPGRE